MLKWISEADDLPPIAQPVLFMHPRQFGEFWDMHVACILVRYEGVVPRPVKPGSRWPTEYWWGAKRGEGADNLVTGNGWWARLDGLPLPPGAEHATDREFHYFAQPKPVWVGQSTDKRALTGKQD